jgi:hypothetical protein
MPGVQEGKGGELTTSAISGRRGNELLSRTSCQHGMDMV